MIFRNIYKKRTPCEDEVHFATPTHYGCFNLDILCLEKKYWCSCCEVNNRSKKNLPWFWKRAICWCKISSFVLNMWEGSGEAEPCIQLLSAMAKGFHEDMKTKCWWWILVVAIADSTSCFFKTNYAWRWIGTIIVYVDIAPQFCISNTMYLWGLSCSCFERVLSSQV